MSEHDPPKSSIPTREDLAIRLRGLLSGSSSRAEVATWASSWMDFDDSIDDLVVWEGLEKLAAADLDGVDRPYLFGSDDFKVWLEEVEKATNDR